MIQYILIYENLAKNYNHNTIIISFLPNNDFKDNDFIFYKENKLDFLNKKQRHRPYFVKSENGYKILFPKKDKKSSIKLIEFLKKYFWSSNILRTGKYLYVSYKLKKAKKKLLINYPKDHKTKHITDYYFTPQYQQEAIIFFFKNLLKIQRRIYYFFQYNYLNIMKLLKIMITEMKYFGGEKLKVLKKNIKIFIFLIWLIMLQRITGIIFFQINVMDIGIARGINGLEKLYLNTY